MSSYGKVRPGEATTLPGFNGLVIAIFWRAVLDARRGKKEAIHWLLNDGRYWMQALDWNVDLVGWVKCECHLGGY